MTEHSEYPGYDGSSPGTWLGMSIVATLLCCTPFGIVGLVYAAMAMDARNRGDVGLMAHRVRLARNWTIAAIVAGVVGIVAAVALGLWGPDS
jgi:Interferon-induced transmembrane protein